MKLDLSDIFILTGLILLGVGLYLLSPAIMFVIIGTVIFLMGLFGAVKPKGGD
ncbi:hypothetical protein [Terrihalobacillus insolitus]|uniref:hypothetical protein n=1 Tax=Terrihalobacillus insolitus TaxID=2950438 RepID=UPI002341E9BA|nr:hypothetical protein [Terrihalobacillus insolitus]MDC3414276.1 hypothetical protein [Terrihalobacillus insolitus]